MKLISLLLTLVSGACLVTGAEPLRIPLWSGEAPLGGGKFEPSPANLTIHVPAAGAANGLAVVICPGGGYGGKVLEGEGHGIARWLNQHGVVGAVLDYRLPRGVPERPILDAQRAVRIVRARAREWNVQPDRVGIMGFSAGGHLASTVGTHFDRGNSQAADLIERQSSRPDFLVLVYPVVSLGEKGHSGSRNNLLGANPPADLVKLYSNELQVTKDTPPAFLTHAKTDAVVPVENSRMFLAALQARKVRAELLEFPQGNHGYNGYKGPEWDAWQKRCLEWLAETFPMRR